MDEKREEKAHSGRKERAEKGSTRERESARSGEGGR